jgi:hypothetical protein
MGFLCKFRCRKADQGGTCGNHCLCALQALGRSFCQSSNFSSAPLLDAATYTAKACYNGTLGTGIWYRYREITLI